MTRPVTFLILAVLVVVLGAMSYIVRQAGKPEPPKPPEMTEAERQKATQERMRQEAEARKKMIEQAQKMQQQQAAQQSASGKPAGKPGARPVNPTAPEPPKNTVPPGALDISEDWFRKRKPGEQGISELEQQQQEQQKHQPAPPKVPMIQRGTAISVPDK